MRSADAVEVAAGLKDQFLRRHKKDRQEALDAWASLVKWAPRLRRDAFAGTQIPKDRFPTRYRAYDNLWKLDLAHGYRAVYSVLARPGVAVVVAVDWMGDHDEYDRLFGYDSD